MIGNLVWLFPAYREAVDRASRAENTAQSVMARVGELSADNSALVARVHELEQYILANQNPLDTFERYQKQILQEEPWEDGKIPDNAWLTPGDRVPERADV